MVSLSSFYTQPKAAVAAWVGAAAASPGSCPAFVVWCLQTCVTTVIPPLAASLAPLSSQEDVRSSGGDRNIETGSFTAWQKSRKPKSYAWRCLFFLFLSLTSSSYSRHLTSQADGNKQKIIKATQRPVQSYLEAKVWVIQLLLLILCFPLTKSSSMFFVFPMPSKQLR